MPVIQFSAASDKGLHRGNNEDCYLSKPECGLWLIADGMGGHEAGEVASAIVAETVGKSFSGKPFDNKPLDSNSLVDAIQQAHRSVLDAVQQGLGAMGMGSTVVALASNERDYQVAWVGDSRAYLWTPDLEGGTLKRLSTDHSYVQMLLASGAIAEEEAANHPDKNVITQCIGSPDVQEVQVDTLRGHWHEGQWILLCSDGLSDELSDAAIADILCASSSLREAVDRLMRQALKHGGRDNITLQLIESPRLGSSLLGSSLLERFSRIRHVSDRLRNRLRALSPERRLQIGVAFALSALFLLFVLS